MSRDEPYTPTDAPGRHNPSHFCEAIGGRVSCPKANCGFCEVDE